MSSTNSLTSRLEELRFRNPQSPSGEHAYTGYSTPNRYSGSFVSNTYSGAGDGRAGLTRRFTADSNVFNAFSALSQQGQAAENMDANASTLYKVQALEKKRMELEKTREQRKRFDAELEKFSRQQAQEERELRQMASDLQTLNFAGGHQSEPTTPPEYRDPLYASMHSRRNRYSSASLVSPPGLHNNRLSRSGSQLTSPPNELSQNGQIEDELDKLPSKSVPGSRRGSSDKFSSYLPDIPSNMPRSSGRTNRYSMPVSSGKPKRESVPEFSTNMGLGHINTTKFLFGDDDEPSHKASTPTEGNTFLQVDTTDDNFPILVRNNQQRNSLSSSSAALDLALSQSPGPESSNGWPSFPRNRLSQNSLPQNAFDVPRSQKQEMSSPSASSQQSFNNTIESPTAIRRPNRHSMEASLASLARHSVFGQTQANGAGTNRPNLANIQSSYSTNDIPTLKNHDSSTSTPRVTPPNAQTNSQFHIHNASLGRIPLGATPNRQSREFSSNDVQREEAVNGNRNLNSEAQTRSTPYTVATTAASPVDATTSFFSSPAMQQYASSAYYGGYGMQLLNMGLSPMQMNGSAVLNSQMPMYQAQQNPYGFQNHNQNGRFQDSQTKVMQQRRMQNAEDIARFNNAKIESYRGEIYGLCKDQHGCRYLQKQLETRNPETIQLIFLETQNHVVELMTDPFGNYLCQKLLEHSNDEQRTVLVNNAASEMVKIALNQHGTRALQKMIEFISTPGQIQTVIASLRDKVVELIQDLNGNHVIQKCLNRLSSEDAQFIFDAVGANCVVVGTHRHGCCVLQRCIDHASGAQKAFLISQITQNAFALVQDPFGNYVLQYIVDLNEPSFTEPLCRSFKGHISGLSKQKFSSNVIEKCLRHAEARVNALMVEEMLNANELEKMLRDSYANYVVQTALDFADRETRGRLTDAIRPILPSIRGTPYGRRIQSKILSQAGETPAPLMPSPMDAGTASAAAVPGIAAPNAMPPAAMPPAVMPGAPLPSAAAQPNASRLHGQSVGALYQSLPGAPGKGPAAVGVAAPPQALPFQQNGILPQSPYAQPGMHHSHGMANAAAAAAAMAHYVPAAAPPPPPPHAQQPQSPGQGMPQYNRMPQANGFNYF